MGDFERVWRLPGAAKRAVGRTPPDSATQYLTSERMGRFSGRRQVTALPLTSEDWGQRPMTSDPEYVKALEATVQQLQAERHQLKAKIEELLLELERTKKLEVAP